MQGQNKVDGVLTYQGRPVLEVVDELLHSKSQAKTYTPPSIRHMMVEFKSDPVQKAGEMTEVSRNKPAQRLQKIMNRTRNARIKRKLAWRIHDTIKEHLA